MRSRVYVRLLALSDEREFLSAVRASRSLHRPWASPPDNPQRFRAYVERMRGPSNCSFFVCERQTHHAAGVINIAHIIGWPLRSAFVSYYVFRGFERRGLMREALKTVVRIAFKSIKLHRLEANIQPGNAASLALARSCGFSKEGFSPRYLKLGGRWRDHERWAIVAP